MYCVAVVGVGVVGSSGGRRAYQCIFSYLSPRARLIVDRYLDSEKIISRLFADDNVVARLQSILSYAL